MKEIVKVSDLFLKYQTPTDEVTAISKISFSVYENEFISIVGPSGCGKSTLLSCIAGLIKPSGGSILINGKPPVPDGSIGYMLQRDALFPWRTSFKNMCLGPEITGAGLSDSEIRKLIKKYDLFGFSDKYPTEISGGMRQRVALIRTLALSPRLLLLDEAFSGLDAQTRSQVGRDIRKIIEHEKKTAVMVTHDITESILLSDRIVVLSARPASVKRIIKIDLLRDVEERRRSELFTYYYDLIEKELKQNE